jgi:hypothetical protein
MMADLMDKIVDVVITRQTTVASMKSFSRLLFVDTFPTDGTTFDANHRVKVIGDPEELITAGLTVDSVPYRAAQKLFSQSPHIQEIYIGVKLPTDTSWGVTLSAIKKQNNGFYGVTTSARLMADQQAVAQWVEANEKLYGIESGDPLIPGEETGDIAAWIKLNNLERSFVIYHPDCAPDGETSKITSGDPMPAVALFGSTFTFQPGSATWMFKDMNAVPTYELETGAFETASGKNAMLYCSVADVPTTFWGKVGSGEYIDIIHGCDWLKARIQNKIFTALKNRKKVPFTNTGIQIIIDSLRAALQEGIDLAELLESFTIEHPDATSVPVDEKGKRNLPDVKFDAPLQGAIHTTRIRGVVRL